MSARYGKIIVPYRQSKDKHGICIYDADACAKGIQGNASVGPIHIVANLTDNIRVTSISLMAQDELVVIGTSTGQMLAYLLVDLCTVKQLLDSFFASLLVTA